MKIGTREITGSVYGFDSGTNYEELVIDLSKISVINREDGFVIVDGCRIKTDIVGLTWAIWVKWFDYLKEPEKKAADLLKKMKENPMPWRPTEYTANYGIDPLYISNRTEDVEKSMKFMKETRYNVPFTRKRTNEEIVEQLNLIIKANQDEDPDFSAKGISDGYHTFDELYEFRKMYNAALFNEWATSYSAKDFGIWKDGFLNNKKNHYNVHKSKRHHDGELCFGGNWFIVSAKLPTGLISNHYKMKDWDLFKIPEVEKALFMYDGHTAKDVLGRIKGIL